MSLSTSSISQASPIAALLPTLQNKPWITNIMTNPGTLRALQEKNISNVTVNSLIALLSHIQLTGNHKEFIEKLLHFLQEIHHSPYGDYPIFRHLYGLPPAPPRTPHVTRLQETSFITSVMNFLLLDVMASVLLPQDDRGQMIDHHCRSDLPKLPIGLVCVSEQLHSSNLLFHQSYSSLCNWTSVVKQAHDWLSVPENKIGLQRACWTLYSEADTTVLQHHPSPAINLHVQLHGLAQSEKAIKIIKNVLCASIHLNWLSMVKYSLMSFAFSL